MSSSPATSSPFPSVPRIHRPRAPRHAAFGLTHPGLIRATNEDAYAVASSVGFFAVADGVGGAAAGEVASEMAIATVLTLIEDTVAMWPEGLGPSMLVRGVKEANAAVRAAAAGDRRKAGMGTTFTGLLLLNDRAVIAHVGDSRAYLLRGRKLSQLTEDHTVVAACVQAGLMTLAEAAVSEMRSAIVRAVGLEEAVEVDTRQVGIEPGDTFLLATDGLHGVLLDEEIAAVLLGERDLTRAAAQLVERANDGGGPDNVSVVLVRVG